MPPEATLALELLHTFTKGKVIRRRNVTFLALGGARVSLEEDRVECVY